MKTDTKKKICRILLLKRVFIIALLILQITFFISLTVIGSQFIKFSEYVLTFVSLVVVLHIVSKKDKDAFKLIWVVQILLFPIFGGLSYLLFNFQASTKKFQKKMSQIEEKSKPLFFLPGDVFEHACAEAPEHTPQMRYLQELVGFPVYKNTKTKYLSSGEMKFEYIVETLKKAEKYIFLEYFIIQEGVMWNTVLDILREKAKNGVDVRVIYDDIGCFLLLPKDYPKKLEAMGIKCMVFNPFRPFLSAKQNNRDHRKILVIDGKTAFTGGANIADEYINAVDKLGHWKDAAIMLEGDGAWSLTVMFFQMWDMCKNINEDIASFYPSGYTGAPRTPGYDIPGDGLIQPYADSPLDDERISEHVYLQIINTAKRYLYINTPYLIIDDSMTSALALAAKSGVDVRIVTPYRGDNWFVHMTTRSYYRELIKAGVKIYEYAKGFIHSKTFVSDDKVATIGTINLDFRSLYLHFECGVWMYKSNAVTDIYSDFIKTLDSCHEITQKNCKYRLPVRVTQDILRLFAPLM